MTDTSNSTNIQHKQCCCNRLNETISQESISDLYYQLRLANDKIGLLTEELERNRNVSIEKLASVRLNLSAEIDFFRDRMLDAQAEVVELTNYVNDSK